jgi:hypothetical protein
MHIQDRNITAVAATDMQASYWLAVLAWLFFYSQSTA